MKPRYLQLLALAVVLIVGVAIFLLISTSTPQAAFDAQRAYRDVEYQVALGPRLPGSPSHASQVAWMVKELAAAGWSTEIQEEKVMDTTAKNVVAKRGTGEPWVILAAHYDTRLYADRDPNQANRRSPVPGANDGASGVAVLLELARTIPVNTPGQVWLVFFDAEDQGELNGWDWILGSTAFAARLQGKPQAVIIIDMIGDADLNIFKELNSDPVLTNQVWAAAARAGYSKQFIDRGKFRILDDHIPFLNKGITAIDIIDFDYPYWHTINDVPSKVAPDSLKAVGETLLTWLKSR
jgi:glutaminyl-peptide cyclotransferase